MFIGQQRIQLVRLHFTTPSP